MAYSSQKIKIPYIDIADFFSESRDAQYTIRGIALQKEKIRFALHWCELNTQEKPAVVSQIAQKLEQVALDSNYHEFLPIIDSTVGDCKRSIGQNTDAIHSYIRAIRHLALADETCKVWRIYSGYGAALLGVGEYAAAIVELQKALLIALQRLKKEAVTEIHILLGQAFTAMGDFSQALENLLSALEIAVELARIDYMANLEILIGETYNKLHMQENAEIWFRKSLIHKEELGDLEGVGIVYGHIAALLSARGEYENALSHLRLSLTIFNEYGNGMLISRTHLNFGQIDLQREQYDQAILNFKISLELAEAYGNRSDLPAILSGIAECWYCNNHYNRAFEFALKALSAAQSINDKKSESEIHKFCANIWEQLRNYEKAYFHCKEFARLKFEAENVQKNRDILNLQARHDLARMEKEQEIYRLNNEKLEMEVLLQKKEKTILSLQLNQSSASLNSLQKKIKEIETNNADDMRSEIVTLQREAKSNALEVTSWRQFEVQFRQLHPDFLEKASRRFSTLTPTELKVCALLKINLNNKEISRILNTGIRNVEMHRYRIRKKIHLSSEDNLATIMIQL